MCKTILAAINKQQNEPDILNNMCKERQNPQDCSACLSDMKNQRLQTKISPERLAALQVKNKNGEHVLLCDQGI